MGVQLVNQPGQTSMLLFFEPTRRKKRVDEESRGDRAIHLFLLRVSAI
jgi:hypothetical protein